MTSYTPGRLFGHYDQFANGGDGNPLPASGYVTITPHPLVVRDADGSTVLSGAWDVDLDQAGDWEANVPPLGDDVDPVNVSYTVSPHLEHANLDPVVGVTVEAGQSTNVNEWTSVLPAEPMVNAQHLAELAQAAAELAAQAAAAAQLAAQGSATAAGQSETNAGQSATSAAQSLASAQQAVLDAIAARNAAAQSATDADADRVAAEAARDQAQAFASTAAPAILTNYAKNPAFQTDTAEWGVLSATLTRTGPGVARWANTAPGSTSASLYLQGTGAGIRVPVAPGQYVAAGVKITALRDLEYTASVGFVDAAGNGLGSVTVAHGAGTVVNAGETKVVGVTDALAPAGTASAYLRLILFDKGQSTAQVVGDYFDALGGAFFVTAQRLGWSVGDVPILYGGLPGVRWTGTAHASISEVYAPPVALLNALAKGGSAYRGIGSPEGVLTAPVSSVYVDEAATCGAIRWVKASGTGATGWRVMDGDTGWRVLVSHTSAGVTNFGAYTGDWQGYNGIGGGVWVRRVNDKVEVHVEAVQATVGGTATSFQTLPLGFRPYRARRNPTDTWLNGGGSAKLTGFTVQTNGNITRGSNAGVAAGDVILGLDYVFSTLDAWPTVLPGNAG